MAESHSTTSAIPGYRREVRHNAETGAFDAAVTHPSGETRALGSRALAADAERLCDAYIYEQLQQQLVLAVEALSAAAGPLLATAGWLAPQLPATPPRGPHSQPANVPIAALALDLVVEGAFDNDGTPNCAYLQTADGHFYCDATGHLAGAWAGIELEIPPEVLPRLRRLFMTSTLAALQALARRWAAAGSA